MISPSAFPVIYYILFCAVRIRGCFRRWRQPLVRGPEWFFNVRVAPDFYSGAGKKVLHRYWMRMFIPFAVDIPIATAIFISGRYLNLVWLVLGLAALIHVNHLFSVDLAERQARRFAVPEAEQPVPSLVLSLQPRRLSNYTNRRVEAFIVLSSLAVMAWLVRFYFTAPGGHSFRLVFATPLILLYAQIGLLVVKSGIVSWRTPIPAAQAEEHLEAREAARKLNLKVCDWLRISYAAQLLFWPWLLSTAPDKQTRLITWFFLVLVGLVIVLTVLHEIGRNAVLKANVRALPRTMPNFLQRAPTGWLVCYQPSAPMLLIKSARGYSLNFANRFTQLGTAYVAGIFLLIALLRMAR